MKNITHKKLFIISLILVSLVFALTLTNCATGDNEENDTSDTTGSTTTTSVTLTSADFSTVGVCSGSLDVTSTAFQASVAAATSVTFVHKTYASDADIPFICGKDGVWDPSDPAAFGATSTVPSTDSLASLIVASSQGFVMICNTGFDFSQVDYGFHDATTFRGEVTFTDGTTTHRARYRFTVSGSGAGQTLASLGLNLSNLTVTDGNNNTMTTVADLLNLFALNPTSITLNVSGGGTTQVTVTGGIICAKAE